MVLPKVDLTVSVLVEMLVDSWDKLRVYLSEVYMNIRTIVKN
jgi:hypothetical protein